MRKENLEITRTQQYIDSNLVTGQIGVQPKSMDKSKHGKNARVESSEKVKDRRSEKVLPLQQGRSCRSPRAGQD